MLTSVLDDPSRGSNSSMYLPCGQFSGSWSGFSISSEASAHTSPLSWQTLMKVSLAISSSFLTASPWTLVAPVAPRMLIRPARRIVSDPNPDIALVQEEAFERHDRDDAESIDLAKEPFDPFRPLTLQLKPVVLFVVVDIDDRGRSDSQRRESPTEIEHGEGILDAGRHLHRLGSPVFRHRRPVRSLVEEHFDIVLAPALPPLEEKVVGIARLFVQQRLDAIVHRIEGRDELIGPGGVDELHHRPAVQGLAFRDLHDRGACGDDSPVQRVGQALADLEVGRRGTVRWNGETRREEDEQAEREDRQKRG